MPAFHDLVDQLSNDQSLHNLGLVRAARLPLVAAIHASTQRPILLITDRADRAFTLADELALWIPEAPKLIFPEPNPLFYEEASWGRSARRERLVALNALVSYHLPGQARVVSPESLPAPIIIASARALS